MMAKPIELLRAGGYKLVWVDYDDAPGFEVRHKDGDFTGFSFYFGVSRMCRELLKAERRRQRAAKRRAR